MATKKGKRDKEKLDFQNIPVSFTKNLRSLEAFIENLAPLAEKQDTATRKKINKVLNQIVKMATPKGIKTDKKEHTIKVQVEDEKTAQKFFKLAASLPRLPLPQADLLYRSSFVMLMSYFDFLLSDLIHYFYKKFPDILSGKELSLTLSELKLFGSVDDAIDYVINKEADNILYNSLAKQKLYLNNTLKIDTKDSIINWDRLTEAMERRNIVVHNDCKINRRYLSNIDASQILEKPKDLKEGVKVQITERYFNSVFEEICVAGLVLLQVCWRKWEKDDRERADEQLIASIYDILVKEDWTCAERLGLFSKECDVTEHASRLILDVNYCQSLKWQGKESKLKEEIKKFDISALSPKFVLAVCALKSDRDGFYENVRNAISVDKMPEETFAEWPLLRELREDPDYYERIHSVFKSIS